LILEAHVNRADGLAVCPAIETVSMRERSTSADGAIDQILFREVQRFRQWFFWIPIAVVTGVVWYEFGQQVVLGHPQGSNPIPNAAAWALTIVFGLGFPAMSIVLRLVTEVTPGLLKVRLAPLPFRHIDLKDVRSLMAREYSPMREFGGWGIRFTRHGKAYNAYGNKGVQLVLGDGSQILIGTQRPEELLAALRSGGASD
jgi:Family of unknown function (DUF6141)